MQFADTSEAFNTAIIAWGAFTILWVVFVFAVCRSGEVLRRKLTYLGMCVVALSLVSLLIPHDIFSDDAVRYRWDGWVTSHGINPYNAPPDDALLDGLRKDFPDSLAYPHLRTIYPPGSQIVFAGIVLIAHTDVWLFKLVWWAFMMGLAGICIWLCTEHQRTLFVIAMASPVVMFHGYMDIHVDVLMALLTLLALLMHQRNMFGSAGAVLALAATVKFLPILALPALLRGVNRQQRLSVIVAFVSLVCAVYVAFLGPELMGSLATFVAKWQTNSGLYTFLSVYFEDQIIRGFLLFAMASCLGLVWWRFRRQPIVAFSASIIVILLCSPVVHPWYLLLPIIMLPFAALRSTIVWGATMCVYGVALSNYKGNGVWTDHPIALAIEYVPVCIAFVYDIQNGPLLFRDQHRFDGVATS